VTRPSSSASTTEDRLRARVAGGDVLLGTFLNTGSPLAAEICARAGFDWGLLDLEHGAASEASLGAHLRALAGTGTAAVVRIEANERARFARVLDAGAEGVMVPRVGTAAEAERAVSFSRYPPAGTRGVAVMNRAADFGSAGPDYTSEANERILGVVQIESVDGVGNVEAIAAVNGVDVLFVGPSDLTYALGIPNETGHERYREAVRRVLEATRRHGKSAGVLVKGEEELEDACALGFRFLAVGSDSSFLATGARTAVKQGRLCLA
jgi:4-hydroxy-2-oxoheptanedioate aldolase